MSKFFQSKLSDSLGLPNLVAKSAKVKIDNDFKTDVLEAFFGALVLTSEIVLVAGAGEPHVRAVLTWLMSQPGNEIDMRYARTNPKSSVDQIFSRTLGEHPKAYWDPVTKLAVLTISPQAVEFFTSLGFSALSTYPRDYRGFTIIGQAEDSDRTYADRAAFRDAYDRLESIGLTTDYVDRWKIQSDMTDVPDRRYRPSEYLPAIKNKLEGKNFVMDTLQFDVIRRNRMPTDRIDLIIYDTEGVSHILDTIDVKRNQEQDPYSYQGKMAVLASYAKS